MRNAAAVVLFLCVTVTGRPRRARGSRPRRRALILGLFVLGTFAVMTGNFSGVNSATHHRQRRGGAVPNFAVEVLSIHPAVGVVIVVQNFQVPSMIAHLLATFAWHKAKFSLQTEAPHKRDNQSCAHRAPNLNSPQSLSVPLVLQRPTLTPS